MDNDDKVFVLRTIQGRKDRQPQLSDAELIQLRQMLREFELIKSGCPIARSVIVED